MAETKRAQVGQANIMGRGISIKQTWPEIVG